LQHIGGLRAHQLGHGAVTKGRAEAFLPRALHENDKNHEEADENFDHREYANQNVHRGREYGGRPSFGKRHLISTPEGGFLPHLKRADYRKHTPSAMETRWDAPKRCLPAEKRQEPHGPYEPGGSCCSNQR
jgi:hypothetical protein